MTSRHNYFENMKLQFMSIYFNVYLFALGISANFAKKSVHRFCLTLVFSTEYSHNWKIEFRFILRLLIQSKVVEVCADLLVL